MPAFTSIILRFRDLSTPAGTTTIEQHKRIITDKGYVWWGWWHKQGETVPENAFQRFSRKSGGLLGPTKFTCSIQANTGCSEPGSRISWDSRLSPIATPERDATPNYYGDSHYLAWYKLENIEDAVLPQAELHKWSYVRVDELFETKKSVFDAFYNKQVASFTELRNQDRTIWFIRPKQDGDGMHEIHVYDRSKTAPSNFTEEVVQLHTPTLLWVSDPHFSNDHHDFPPLPAGVTRKNLSEAIRHDLEHEGITTVGALLISGDLTWRGTREEFEWAAKFIQDITSWAKLTPSRVVICPGNHDLAFSKEPWKKGVPATQVSEAAVAEYKRFYEELYEVKPTEYLACGRRFWMPDGAMVDVASLNSSVLQQVEGAFQGQGFVGAPQLTETAKAMKWSRDRSRIKAYRICMLHHHVVPILHREHPEIGIAGSVVYDAGALMRWLVENEVDLVLHGHMHLPSIVKERRALDYPRQENWHEVTVAALGSSGVTAGHRPANQTNSYGLIKFTREAINLIVRRISADDAIPHDQRPVYSTMLPYQQS